MKGLKVYRHKSNPKEKEFHDKFIEQHGDNDMSMIVFPSNGLSPSEYLSRREESIVITTIQWLGSPVGQGFLRECGFVKDTYQESGKICDVTLPKVKKKDNLIIRFFKKLFI